MKNVPNPPPSERLAFSIKELALADGLSEDKIRDEIRSGRLLARKVGRRTIITKEDHRRWLAGLPVLVACVILVACALLAVAASEWQTAAIQGDLTSQYRLAQPCPSEGVFVALAIDFAAINRAALAVLPSLLVRWAPGGIVCGSEYVALNPTRADRRPGSFKVNLRSGKWADFATGDKGGDPIGLAAYLSGTGQAEAARNLAAMLGMSHD